MAEATPQCEFVDEVLTRCVSIAGHPSGHVIPRNGELVVVNASARPRQRKEVVLRLDEENLLKLLDETHVVLDQATQPRITPGVWAINADQLLTRWMGLQTALPGGPSAPTVLPRTREELAEFFGDIRDDKSRCVTGYFVEQALAYLILDAARDDKANVNPDHLRRVEQADRLAAQGVGELRDVMDGKREYDEDGNLR